jgi:hypothetical protein
MPHELRTDSETIHPLAVCWLTVVAAAYVYPKIALVVEDKRAAQGFILLAIGIISLIKVGECGLHVGCERHQFRGRFGGYLGMGVNW